MQQTLDTVRTAASRALAEHVNVLQFPTNADGYRQRRHRRRCLHRRPRDVSTPDQTGPILDAAKAILRPLVRVLIARGVTLPTLVAALKEVFVAVAERDFRLAGRPPSDSRISLLTGVHRKDVRVIRDGAPPISTPRAASLGAAVIGRWLGDPALADAEGRPRTLSRIEFDALVATVSKDVRGRTVLDELSRLGLIDRDEEMVSLLGEAFVPPAGGGEQLGFFARNLEDHVAAAGHNLLAEADDRRFLERAVFYNNLGADDVDRLEAEARTLAAAALRHLNGLALEAREAARERPDATERFRFGVFFYREDTGRGVSGPAPNPPETTP